MFYELSDRATDRCWENDNLVVSYEHKTKLLTEDIL